MTWPLGRLRRNSSFERANAVGGEIHGALDQNDWGREGARAVENGPRLDDNRQVLTGLGFNSATAAACRTTFDCQG